MVGVQWLGTSLLHYEGQHLPLGVLKKLNVFKAFVWWREEEGRGN